MVGRLVPLRKLKNDPSPAKAECIQELLKAYNAAPSKMTSTGKTMHGRGAEDATSLAVLKRYQPAVI